MKNKSVTFIFIISLLMFLSVTFIFNADNGFLYDQNMMNWVDKTTTSGIEQMMEFISYIGSSEVILILTFLIAVAFAFKRKWFYLFFFLTVSVGGVVVNFLLKIIFQRERPGEMSYIEAFNISLEIPSYSFPSGHTMRATILLVFLIFISSRLIYRHFYKFLAYIFLVATMVGVALSRLFLDAHFLSDVLGAMTVSIAWFSLCFLLLQKYEARNSTRLKFANRSWNR